MFGYIMIDRQELKGKDLDRYQAYYCGICQDLKRIGKEGSRLTLTYDMTFLAILLTGLYEGNAVPEKKACILHPLRKKPCICNEYTAYAAEMNILLVYHNLMDDWLDEKNVLHYSMAKSLSGSYQKISDKYPRQSRAIAVYLEQLHKTEEENVPSVDQAAGLTGKLMAEIFQYHSDDIWKEDLGEMGFYLGKFIYLMDAWEDLDKDRKKKNYNPLESIADREDYEDRTAHILAMMAAGAARAFERLPILENVDILRNILYSGIWIKYRMLKEKKDKKNLQEKEENRPNDAGSL